jgi:hypothetical protein
MESQDCEPKLELLLSQLPDQPFSYYNYLLERSCQAGPFERRKQPCVEQFWHENLQDDARALVILLQVGSVEPGRHDITFHGHYQGPNLDHYRRISRHHLYLDGLVYPLLRDQRAAFVAATLQRILEFLEM